MTKILIIINLLLINKILAINDDFRKMQNFYTNLANVYQNYTMKFNNNQQLNLTRITSKIVSKRTIENHNYDFIIIGSGSAGSVIANRLTEIPEWNVLLLEAGKVENKFSQIPIAAPTLQFTHYNWKYFTQYQPNMCLGLNEKRMHWPRGKALGGSSVINYMIYTRGNEYDYNKWANQGNPGWSYNDILPLFIKSERTMLQNYNSYYHGKNGYLSTSDSYQSQLVQTFINSGKEVNLPQIDYNSNTNIGFATVQATILNGKRHSVANAFLQPIKHRPNLHIKTSIYVTKILINPETNEAYGIIYKKNNKLFKIKAKKEIILSAGTINSPKLLMLSGIGPENHLKSKHIQTLVNLEGVGRNLQDHLTYPALAFLINQQLSLSIRQFLNPKNYFDFFFRGKGPFTSLGGVEGIGYIQLNNNTIPNYPDIELIFLGGTLATDNSITRIGMNINNDIYNNLFKPIERLPQFTIFPMLLHPKSKGWLELKTNNPYDPPLLYGNYFTDPSDIQTLLKSIRFLQYLVKTNAFQQFNTTMNDIPIRTCLKNHIEYDSDDYWLCALRTLSVTLHHQIGTCKMGNDHNSVVDHKLRVYGVKKLRIADCSIIPFSLSAHTNAPAMMVGEKAANLIKTTWLQPHH